MQRPRAGTKQYNIRIYSAIHTRSELGSIHYLYRKRMTLEKHDNNNKATKKKMIRFFFAVLPHRLLVYRFGSSV